MTKVNQNCYLGEIKYPQESHMVCLFLVDVSASMGDPENKRPVDSINEGLKIFKQEVCKDKITSNIVDVAVVTFGGSDNTAQVVSGFMPVSYFNPPTLTTEGLTPMGEGLELAIDLVRKKVKQYRITGTDAYIPWVIMLTDGYATDSMEKAKALLEEEYKKGRHGRLKLWIVTTNDRKLEEYKELTNRVLYVTDGDFRPYLYWMAKECLCCLNQAYCEKNRRTPQIPSNIKIIH